MHIQNSLRRILDHLEYVVVFLLLAFSLAFLLLSPPTTPPDEMAHLGYPRQILLTRSLPSYITPQDLWESHQPPLYYLISVPFVYFASGNSIATQIVLNRLASFFLFALTLGIALVYLRKITKDSLTRAISLLWFGLPMVLYASASFSNDIAALLCTAICILLVLYRSSINSMRSYFIFGLGVGLLLLSRLNCYPIIAITFLIVLLRKSLRYWLVAGLGAILSSWWWFWHNIQSTGDLFGLKYTFLLWKNQAADFTQPSTWTNLAAKSAASFVGVFGKLEITLPYVLYGIVLVLIVLFFFYTFKKVRTPGIYLPLVGILLSVIFFFVQNLTFYQPQGRYLISIIPLCALLTAEIIGNTKWKKGIFLFGIITIIGTSFISLYVISSFYSSRNIEGTKNPTTKNIEQTLVGAEPGMITKAEAGLHILTPSFVYTLADLRLDSQHVPSVVVSLSNNTWIPCQIYWKVLGQNSFSEERSVKTSCGTHTQILLPEHTKTFIQDIAIRFQEKHGTIQISELVVSTQ